MIELIEKELSVSAFIQNAPFLPVQYFPLQFLVAACTSALSVGVPCH